MTLLVGIIDYKISNICSVETAFEHLGVPCTRLSNCDAFNICTHLVLPGVGSFSNGMHKLHHLNLVDPILRAASAGVPLLGMCLGMQLLADSGDEFGPSKGLGLLPGRISQVQLSDDLRLPHIGWNDIISIKPSLLLAGIPSGASFYFIHSYSYADSHASYVTAVTDYGGRQVAIVELNNIMGTQFHPEKSQKHGLKLLQNFISFPSPIQKC